MSQRIIVISDLHLAAAGPLNNFHAGHELVALINELASAGTTLAIAGDGLDLLQFPDRPDVLEMSSAPALLERALNDIGKQPWGPKLFEGLRKLLDAGGRVVILPGNHDPELFHPDAREVLLRAIAPTSSSAALEVHVSEFPWWTTVGRWEVEVGHGHRQDPWNDIDPDKLVGALAASDRGVELPPGSRLVLKVLNVFKDARDKDDKPRFPFVDLLKPETPAVPLLLLYLDPKLALPHLGTALGLAPAVLIQALRQVLMTERVLGPGARSEDQSFADVLAQQIAGGFPANERKAPQTCIRQFESWLAGSRGAAPGTLASHGGKGRFLLRAFLKAASADGTFFDRSTPSAHDSAIIAKYLMPKMGPRVLISGHTHAAREIRLADDRVYLNTGTWTDLMRMPHFEDDAAVLAFADAIEKGEVPRLRRLTYAEVTADGPRLLEWPARTA